MEAIAIFDVLRRYVYMIFTLTIVTAIAGYGISFVKNLIPEKYDASAVVMVRPHDPIKIDTQMPGKEFLGFPVGQTPVVESASKTYIQIIQSPALVSEVVRELKLDQKAEPGQTLFDEIPAPVRVFFNNAQEYLTDAIAAFKYGRVIRDDPFTRAVEDVTKNLALKSYEDTYVFEIKYSGDNPQTSAAVANTTAKLFIQFLETMRSAEAKDAAARLKTDLDESRERLVAAREGLRDFKVAHNVFLYQPEYEAKLKVISDLAVELAKLDESMAAGTLEAGTYARRRARLAQSIDEERAELAPLPTIERELHLRQSDVDVADTAYATVAKELRDAEMKSDPMPDARLISVAFASQLPTKPRRVVIVGVALLAGLLVSVALAFFLKYIDRTVRGINDIEDFVGLKVVATIPRLINIPTVPT